MHDRLRQRRTPVERHTPARPRACIASRSRARAASGLLTHTMRPAAAHVQPASAAPISTPTPHRYYRRKGGRPSAGSPSRPGSLDHRGGLWSVRPCRLRQRPRSRSGRGGHDTQPQPAEQPGGWSRSRGSFRVSHVPRNKAGRSAEQPVSHATERHPTLLDRSLVRPPNRREDPGPTP